MSIRRPRRASSSTARRFLHSGARGRLLALAGDRSGVRSWSRLLSLGRTTDHVDRSIWRSSMAMPIDRQSARPVRIIDETNYGLSRVPFDFSTLLFLGLGTRLATLPFLGMI